MDSTPISKRPKLSLFGVDKEIEDKTTAKLKAQTKSSIILERRVETLEQTVKDLEARLDKIDGLS